MNNIEFTDKMHIYLSSLCNHSDLLYGLKLFSDGVGYQLGAIMIEFSDDPDINDPY